MGERTWFVGQRYSTRHTATNHRWQTGSHFIAAESLSNGLPTSPILIHHPRDDRSPRRIGDGQQSFERVAVDKLLADADVRRGDFHFCERVLVDQLVLPSHVQERSSFPAALRTIAERISTTNRRKPAAAIRRVAVRSATSATSATAAASPTVKPLARAAATPNG